MDIRGKDEQILSSAVKSAEREFYNANILRLPQGWNIELGNAKLSFYDISNMLEESNKIPKDVIDEYFGINTSIVADANIVYLNANGKKRILFFGEIKKQGTNDTRISEGKEPQAVGNAVERYAKNHSILLNVCSNLGRTNKFFPFTLFCHGCDFSKETMKDYVKGKLQPIFGNLNKFNPWISPYFSASGGTCYCQNEMFTSNDIIEKSYRCMETGLNYYLKNKKHL